MKKILFLFWAGLFFLVPALYAEDIEIMGKVVDKTTQSGIGDVTVVVFPSGEKTTTKPNGNFYFKTEIKEGMLVQVMKPGYKPVKIKDNLTEIYVELELLTQIQGQKVVVEGKKDEKRVVVSRQQVSRENIQRSTANLFGDAVKVVQSMPGVVSTGEFSALMYVRGGNAYEVMNFYDRILLFNAYVWGGMMSVYNPDVVQNIDFYSGAFPAEYGNAMSGIMDVRMRDGKTDSFGGLFDLSLATFTGLFEGPIGEPGKTENSFLIAVRRTHYDLAVKLLAETGAIDKKYSGVQFPFFYDAHTRLKFKLNNYNILKIFSLVVYEGMDVKFDDVSKSNESTDGWKAGNEFHYMDFRATQGLSLTSAFSKDFLMENTLGYDYSYGDFKYVDAKNPTNLKYTGHYLSWRNDTTIKPNNWNTLKAGLGMYLYFYNMNGRIIVSSLPDQIDYASLALPAPYTNTVEQFDGNYYTTQGTYEFLVSQLGKDYSMNYKQQTYFVPNVYIQDDMEVVENFLFLNLGFRADYFNISGNYTFDPRAGMKMVFKDLFNLKLAGGVYSQQIYNGIYYDKTMGNPNLKPSKSYHGVVSFEKDIPNYFFRLDFFYKYYTDLVNADPDPNIRYRNGSVGRSYGFDLFLQKKIDKSWDGWISYTFVITQRKVNERSPGDSNNVDFGNNTLGNIPVGVWYYPEYDRRHSLNIILNYTIAPKWEISSTTKFATGVPFTPLNGRRTMQVTDTGDHTGVASPDTTYFPIWGSYNSSRMPFYMNMDIKISMPFFWEKWSSYVQLMNVFGLVGGKKVEQYYYDEKYSVRRETTGLPFLIIAGIKAEF